MRGLHARWLIVLSAALLFAGCDRTQGPEDAATSAIAASPSEAAAPAGSSAASFDGSLVFKDSFDPDATRHGTANAYWLARASELAYLDGDAFQTEVEPWGVECRFVSHGVTQAHIAANSRFMIVAFRGTETNAGDIATDGNFGLMDWAGPGRVHGGFHTALEGTWPDLLAAIQDLRQPGQSLWFTGHSLGGALAVLGAMRWSEEAHLPALSAVYTFGQPMVGDREFVAAYTTALGERTFRYVNNLDVVPRVPLESQGYGHAGKMFHFDAGGNLDSEPPLWRSLVETALADPAKARESLESAIGSPAKARESLESAAADHGAVKYVERVRGAVEE